MATNILTPEAANTPGLGQIVDESRLLHALIEQSSLGVLVVDERCVIRFANPIAQTLCACTQLVGKPCHELFSEGLSPAQISDMHSSIAEARVWTLEAMMNRVNGTHFLGRFELLPLTDAKSGLTQWCAVLREVNHLKRGAEEIHRLSTLDQLTLLPNRAQFMQDLGQTLRRADAAGDLALMMLIDVDHLRGINEAVGHAVGDQLLLAIADRMREASRRQDLLARLGGDEFALVMSGGTDPDALREAAERFMNSLASDLVVQEHAIRFSLTAGTALFPADAGHVDDLISCAERALLAEKGEPDGGICHFVTGLGTVGLEHARAVEELRKAISNGELRLSYQPQLSLHSGQIIGLEALVRWEHPTRGLLAPIHFIGLAEESGLVVALGDWVMRTAVEQISQWREEGLPPVRVAVNLSAQHFRQKDLPTAIENLLLEYAVPASLFELELTESVMVRDADAAIRIVDRLKALGIRISLDDFGTGYSSLAYLSRFAIDAIKIDQSFVLGITTNTVNASIATAIIAMAHKLGKTVIAEGVETQGQMLYLRRHECDEMQGYLFSRPVDATAIGAMLRRAAGISFGLDQGAAPMTLLLVDDEPSILNAVKRLLRREGYRILSAESAAQGLDLLATHRVHVVISDQRMPVMTGTEFLSRVKELYPETVRLILSGYSELDSLTDAINKGAIYRYVSKPWDDEALKQEVAQAFRYYREHNPASSLGENQHESG